MKPEKIYTHEEMLDKVLGKPGDLAREQYETDINAFLIGETIKKARLQRKLTQAQLGELMGVKRAQVSRIEGGRNLTFATLSRAFKAMGVAATIEAKGIGRCRFGSVCRFITSKQLTTSCWFGRITCPCGVKLTNKTHAIFVVTPPFNSL